MLDFQMKIHGFRATKKLMRELEPDLLKALNKEVRRQLEPVISLAQRNTPSQLPLRRWRTPANPNTRPSYSPYGRRWDYARLEWDGAQAKREIVLRQKSRRKRGSVDRTIYQLQSNNPANAVYELMGRGKSKVHMVGNVGRKFPGTGRVLYRAYDQLGGDDRVERQVVDTIRSFEAEFNRRLNARTP